MKITTLTFTVLLLYVTAKAQSDSAFLDLGRITLRKDFTQTITIKGDDLGRLPFMRLSEAVRLWANGAYTNKTTMAYVIDGMAVNDADAYSIHDIEEITIVQNALTNQNGSGNLQLLAIITTKQWKEGKPTLIITGQLHMLKRKITPALPGGNQQKNRETVVAGSFQQYGISAGGGYKGFRFGGSLYYLHDALPQRNNTDSLYSKTIPNIDRIKINAWGEAAIGKKNIVTVQASFSPQFYSNNTQQIITDRRIYDNEKENEYLINSSLALATRFSSTLKNKLSFSYLNGRQLFNSNSKALSENNGFSNNELHDSLRTEVLVLNDQVSYTKQMGNWLLEPSVNFTFQKGFHKTAALQVQTYNSSPPNTSYHWSMSKHWGKILTGSPSVAVSYRSLFYFQGGILLDGTKFINKKYTAGRAYPFANMAFNLLPALNKESSMVWKIYGSYSEHFLYFDNPYLLSDFNHTVSAPALLAVIPYPTGVGLSSALSPASRYSTMWQTGSTVSFFKDRLSLNYNFLSAEQRELRSIEVFPGTGLGNLTIAGKYTRKQHHINMVVKALEIQNFQWTAGIFTNAFSNKLNFDRAAPRLSYTEKPNTGGLTNRVSYRRFSGGCDILYLFNKEVSATTNTGIITAKHNAIQLPHIYLAYSFKAWRFNGADVYLSCSNFADSQTYPLSDDGKRYYGGGFKVNM